MSKFSFDVLKRRVFPVTATNDVDVLLEVAFGEDVALTKAGGDILASHVDPVVGAVGNIGWLDDVECPSHIVLGREHSPFSG